MNNLERHLRRDGYGVLVGVQVVDEPGRCRLGVGRVWWSSWEAQIPDSSGSRLRPGLVCHASLWEKVSRSVYELQLHLLMFVSRNIILLLSFLVCFSGNFEPFLLCKYLNAEVQWFFVRLYIWLLLLLSKLAQTKHLKTSIVLFSSVFESHLH